MHWLWIVITGHILTSVSIVLSKALLSRAFNNPFVFIFYVGILSILVVFLIPFGFELPSVYTIMFNLATGAIFVLALGMFYVALQNSEASRMAPFIGAVIPVLLLFFELQVLHISLSKQHLIAFIILLFGSLLITLDFNKKTAIPKKIWFYGMLSAGLFAISFAMTKTAFIHQPFLSAFIWMRFGSVLIVLPLLFTRHRLEIIEAIRELKGKSGIMYLLTQLFGSLGFVFINYGIALASVALVNALQGVQYIFLLLLAVAVSKKYPELMKENVAPKTMALKFFAILIIMGGIYLIAQPL